LKRSFFVVALAGTALVSLPFEARAQVSTVAKPVQFGIAAGAAIPVSDLSTFFSTGFNGTVTVGFHPQLIPLGVRVDGAYNQLGVKGGGANIHFTSVTGNLVYSIPSETVAPYLIGGAGLYNVGGSGGGGSSNNFGWNIGGGITMPLSGFDTFLEARYNQVQGNGGSSKFVPITFGVMF
jgi:Outer membrane protein beta-barrel domain